MPPGRRARMSQTSQPQSQPTTRKGPHPTESIAATFLAAWPGPVPACFGQWQAAYPPRSSLPQRLAPPRRQPTTPALGSALFRSATATLASTRPPIRTSPGTLRLAIDKINALPGAPDFLLHTGDITQSAKASEFDTAQQILKASRVGEIHYVLGAGIRHCE